MEILPQDRISDCLWQYYLYNYGDDGTDVWYAQPADNVWVFGKNGKTITLKCHMLTGIVMEHIEERSV